ncbi:MAG TPA: hypothetical protein VE999_01555 [Gemmataceae bacterium]|nr:hypothetical protein [Gemmataceae bacterium]
MSALCPRVYVERIAAKRFAEVILQPYAVEIIDGGTSSGAISKAMGSLLDNPEQPVAVLLDGPSGTSREIAEERATIKRLLARAALEGWYVALAIPRLDAWAMTDPRIKQDFESFQHGKASYQDRSLRIGELIKRHPFDPSELYRSNADFKGLVEFLQKHSPVPTTGS